jgi:hypothetical protein
VVARPSGQVEEDEQTVASKADAHEFLKYLKSALDEKRPTASERESWVRHTAAIVTLAWVGVGAVVEGVGVIGLRCVYPGSGGSNCCFALTGMTRMGRSESSGPSPGADRATAAKVPCLAELGDGRVKSLCARRGCARDAPVSSPRGHHWRAVRASAPPQKGVVPLHLAGDPLRVQHPAFCLRIVSAR